MEKFINDLSDAYSYVKRHENSGNDIQVKSALNDMIGTCVMIIEKCNNLKSTMYY